MLETNVRNDAFHTSRVSWPVLLLCLAACFVGVFGRDLWTPDEPRVAAISLEMSRTGNLAVPYLAGEPFVEKPPLYFIVAAAFVRLIGPFAGNTGAIRLTSALWGVGVLAMTFLLAKRLVGRERAMLASLILATMVGFVENMHWIRIDAALSFFVAASVWSFSEVYFGGRRWLCLPAGLFTAAAFLSKGMVGPVLIAVAWVSMIVPWLMRQWREKKGLELFIPHHLMCLFVFALLAGTWMIMFRKVGGENLWHEWFWKNHVGRLLGTASLGHKRPGHPLYYVGTFSLYSLPWTPLLVVWAGAVCRNWWKTRTLSASRIFLLIWSVGSVMLLSLSVTKRDIYLLPVLPAFAIICAEAFGEELPRWCKTFFTFWIGFCAVILLVLTVSPLIARLIPASEPNRMVDFLEAATMRNIVTGIGAALCLYLIFAQNKVSLQSRAIAVTAVLYLGFFIVMGEAIDRDKSMKDDIATFVQQVPPERRPYVAGWKFSETMLGCFYYYSDWSVSQIHDVTRLKKVIEGKDSKFDSVIIMRERSIPKLLEMPYDILAEGYPGDFSHKRALVWVEGAGDKEMKHQETTRREGRH